MTFDESLDQAVAMLQRHGRLTYGTLKRQFHPDDATPDDLKEQLLYAHLQVVDEVGRGVVWTGETAGSPTASPAFPASTVRTIAGSPSLPMRSCIRRRSMARNWNTSVTATCRKPFSAVDCFSVVPANRVAALVVVSGTTSTTGSSPMALATGGRTGVFSTRRPRWPMRRSGARKKTLSRSWMRKR